MNWIIVRFKGIFFLTKLYIISRLNTLSRFYFEFILKKAHVNKKSCCITVTEDYPPPLPPHPLVFMRVLVLSRGLSPVKKLGEHPVVRYLPLIEVVLKLVSLLCPLQGRFTLHCIAISTGTEEHGTFNVTQGSKPCSKVSITIWKQRTNNVETQAKAVQGPAHRAWATLFEFFFG